MAKEIRLPQLGQTMEEGTIVTTLVKEGDQVEKGDCIFEIETDKATLEMESPADGFVKKILVDVGQTISVNTPILILGDKNERIEQSFIDSLKVGAGQGPAPASEVHAGPVVEPATVKTEPAKSAESVKTGRIFASPRAKAVARELGVDLSMVSPAPGAVRITEADVRKAACAPGAGGGKAPAPATPEPAYKLGQKITLTRLQKITGRKMLQSKREIPCYYLNTRVDVTELVSLRARLNKTAEPKISFNDFIIRATALALKQFPIMTGQPAGDFIQLAPQIHIGLAITVPDGLVAPLVRDADTKNVAQIAAYGKDLIARAKANKLSPDDLAGGCITVSNLGGFGIDFFLPIVVPGQCSIIGVGRITDTCMPVDGNIIVRKLTHHTI